MILSGRTISPGQAAGVAQVVGSRSVLSLALHSPPQGAAEQECERLRAAIALACVQLDRVQRHLTGRVSASDVSIFNSHAGLLRDAKLISQIEQQIREQGHSAPAAVARVITDLHQKFLSSPVDLVQDKAADILDIGRRLVHCLSADPRPDLEPRERPTVVVAEALTPSEFVRLVHQGVVGFITETCGSKSHTAILARGLGVPLLTNVADACQLIVDESELLVDSDSGRLLIAETEAEHEQVASFLKQQTADGSERLVAPERPVTDDGVPIRLLLNISDPSEAEIVRKWQADGVGLFRTEFLYMDRNWWPTSDDSYALYRQVADTLETAELHIRLVDFGADKCPAYADIPVNRNPSLGLRGMRLLLQREDILQPQVLAIARLARERPVTLTLPMLDTLDSLATTFDRLCRIVGCTDRTELPFRVGAMIEVPSAALMIDELLPLVDSISIGLNDLTQYLLAADRDDEFVEHYHDAMQPAVLRLLRRIVTAADACGKPVTICGEMAGDPKLTGLLLALGLRRLSVSRSSYRGVVEVIRKLSIGRLMAMTDEVLQLSTGAAVRKYISEQFNTP